MEIAPFPENEEERLNALLRYKILDTETEQDFDELVQLASKICDVPISLISLVSKDKQWFKAKVGLEPQETSRDVAFCAHAIHNKDIFEIKNALEDERFSDNPLVTEDPSIRFYAGMPLETPDGYNLGTLCVIDRKAKTLNEDQKEALRIIAKQVINQLELRLKVAELNKERDEVKSTNEELLRSINYAKETKDNVLASKKDINLYFDDVLFLEIPYGVISSDFVWVNSDDGCNVLVLIDACKTGLSGIFISLLLNNLLKNIVEKHKITDPKGIVYQVQEQTQSLSEFADVDKLKISVVVFDKKDNMVSFSGAGQDIIYLKEGMAFLFQNNNSPINKKDNIEEFSSEYFTIDADSQDYFYIFSDGLDRSLMDDFSKLLESTNNTDIQEREEIINNKIKEWYKSKDLKQQDDILIVGFKPRL